MNTKEFFKKYTISFIITIIIIIGFWIWVIINVQPVCTDSIPPICSGPSDFVLPVLAVGLISWVVLFLLSLIYHKLKT